MSRSIITGTVAALAIVLLLLGIAQTISPAVRTSMTEIYLGVPSWLFIPAGIYQIGSALMMLIPKHRVSGAMHAGVISLVSVGFSFFGDGILNLIPLGIAMAVLAFTVAWYFRTGRDQVSAH